MLSEEASLLSLTIIWAKTKIQSLSDYFPPPQPVTSVNTEEVQEVRSILRSIGACSTTGHLRRAWHSSRIHPMSKLRVPNSCVLSVLLYGCETWSPTVGWACRVYTYPRTCLRYIFAIRLSDFVSNVELYSRAGSVTPLCTAIRGRRLQLLGDVAHMEDSVQAKRALMATSRSQLKDCHHPLSHPQLTWAQQMEEHYLLADLTVTAQDRMLDTRRW